MEKTIAEWSQLIDNTLVQTDRLARVSFSRVTAKMMPNGDQTRISLTYDGDIADGSYLLTQAPPEQSLTVRRAILDILGETNLQKLCMNLEASASLIDIAYNACNGMGDAHTSLYVLRNDVFSAVGDSVSLAKKFVKASNLILEASLDVYGCLSVAENCDIRTIRVNLRHIGKAAQGLAEQAQAMSKRFDILKDKTFDQGKSLVAFEGDNIKQLGDLQNQLSSYKAKLEAFNVTKKGIEKQIQQAQTLYTKYDNEARELNKSADNMEMLSAIMTGVSGIAEGVGAALAGYASAQTPKINLSTPATPPAAGKPTPEKAPETPPPPSKEMLARQELLGSDKAELELINARLAEYEKQIVLLEKEKNAAEKTRTSSEIEAEIGKIKTSQTTDGKRKQTLEQQIKGHEVCLATLAECALSNSVAATAKNLEGKFDNIAGNARTAAAAKDKAAQEILRLKFEMEQKDTEMLANIAEFTQRIKNSNIEVIDTSVIINSLQLAVTCLSTVVATLATVARFWESLEGACSELASDRTVESLSELMEDEDDVAGLVHYATTNTMFCRNWFIMEAKWQAIATVSNAYYLSCERANQTLDTSLKRVETDRRAHWKLAQQMAAVLEEKLQVSLRCEQSKDAEFQKRVELAQKAKDQLLLDI